MLQNLPQEARNFGNNIEKELQKPHLKMENIYIKYLQRIFAPLVIQCKW